MRSFHALAIGLLAVVSGPAVAAVASSGPAGFVVKFDMPIAAPRADVYARLLEIGKWWSDTHTYSGAAANMSIVNQPGGCFCEQVKSGSFVRHMSVEVSLAPALLRMSGALGPLADLGAQGTLSIQLAAANEKATTFTATYIVGGYHSANGLQEMAAPVDGVLKEQFDRFKRFAETGKPTP